MTKVRMYKVLIAVADSNSEVMDIMQYMANDNDINSEEFFELFTECKARIAQVLGTPASLRV